MKFNLIRNLLPGFISLLLLLILTTPTSASPRGSCNEPGADGIKVELDFASKPVKIGSNEIIVKLHDADGKPIGGVEVTVSAAQSLQTDPASHNEAQDDHAHQAQPDAQSQADTVCSTGVEVDSHQPAQAAEHDMADMASQAGVEPDGHQPAAESSHGGGHSGGHDEPALAELVAGPMPGEYQGQVNFTAEGGWLVKVNFTAQGHTKEVEFTIDVVKRGPNWYVLGGFLSVNMLVVTTAAVMKYRTAKA